jgi:hypothetical protein
VELRTVFRITVYKLFINRLTNTRRGCYDAIAYSHPLSSHIERCDNLASLSSDGHRSRSDCGMAVSLATYLTSLLPVTPQSQKGVRLPTPVSSRATGTASNNGREIWWVLKPAESRSARLAIWTVSSLASASVYLTMLFLFLPYARLCFNNIAGTKTSSRWSKSITAWACLSRTPKLVEFRLQAKLQYRRQCKPSCCAVDWSSRSHEPLYITIQIRSSAAHTARPL